MSEAVASGLTAGGLLREARQASGMHIAALAGALKVPVSKLEALEADNFRELPDTVFVRALASSGGRDSAAAGGVLGFKPKWRARHDSNVRLLPSEGSTLSS